jgi:hypothetical protein
MRTTADPVRFPDIEPATIEFRAIPAQPLDLREYWAAEAPAGPTSWGEAAELVRRRRGGAEQTTVLLAGGAGALLGLAVWALFDAGLLPF